MFSMFTVQERLDPVGDAFEETGSVSLARKKVAEEMAKEVNPRHGYCRVCGSPMKYIGIEKKVPTYNPFNGEPEIYDDFLRCSINPCHQGHLWVKSDNKILDFIIGKICHMGIGDLMECQICGKKKISVLE